MHIQYRAFAAIVLTGCLLSAPAHAEIVIVVGSKSGASGLSKEQVSDLYLSKLKQLPGGGQVDPVMLAASPARDEFLSKVMDKTEAQAKAYWAKLTFTGKGSAPKEVANAGELKRLLSTNPNGIGYLDKSEVDATVKVVFTP